jgi:hypothetical protein
MEFVAATNEQHSLSIGAGMDGANADTLGADGERAGDRTIAPHGTAATGPPGLVQQHMTGTGVTAEGTPSRFQVPRAIFCSAMPSRPYLGAKLTCERVDPVAHGITDSFVEDKHLEIFSLPVQDSIAEFNVQRPFGDTLREACESLASGRDDPAPSGSDEKRRRVCAEGPSGQAAAMEFVAATNEQHSLSIGAGMDGANADTLGADGERAGDRTIAPNVWAAESLAPRLARTSTRDTGVDTVDSALVRGNLSDRASGFCTGGEGEVVEFERSARQRPTGLMPSRLASNEHAVETGVARAKGSTEMDAAVDSCHISPGPDSQFSHVVEGAVGTPRHSIATDERQTLGAKCAVESDTFSWSANRSSSKLSRSSACSSDSNTSAFMISCATSDPSAVVMHAPSGPRNQHQHESQSSFDALYASQVDDADAIEGGKTVLLFGKFAGNWFQFLLTPGDPAAWAAWFMQSPERLSNHPQASELRTWLLAQQPTAKPVSAGHGPLRQQRSPCDYRSPTEPASHSLRGAPTASQTFSKLGVEPSEAGSVGSHAATPNAEQPRDTFRESARSYSISQPMHSAARTMPAIPSRAGNDMVSATVGTILTSTNAVSPTVGSVNAVVSPTIGLQSSVPTVQPSGPWSPATSERARAESCNGKPGLANNARTGRAHESTASEPVASTLGNPSIAENVMATVTLQRSCATLLSTPRTSMPWMETQQD